MIPLLLSKLFLAACCVIIVQCEGWRPQGIQLLRTRTTRTAIRSASPDSTIHDAIENAKENRHEAAVSITIPPYHPESSYPYPSRLHSIHIVPLLTDAEVRTCHDLAQRHAVQTRCWQQPDAQRHVTYPTCDFPVDQCTALQQYLENDLSFDERIFQALHTFYDIPIENMVYLDLFCAHYQAATVGSTTTMDRLEAHRDGSLLSFTILLNDPTEFAGGGTFFDALVGNFPEGVVRPTRAGDAVLHCGKLLHGGHVVTAGSRTVLVGFVDVIFDDDDNNILRPGVLGQACRDWGRLDVASFRSKRQQRPRKDDSKFWFRPRGRKWQPSGDGLSNTCPSRLASVRRLANVEYQRKRRLEIEDQFLRSILYLDDKRLGHGQRLKSCVTGELAGEDDYKVLPDEGLLVSSDE